MLQRRAQVFLESCLDSDALTHGSKVLIDGEVRLLACTCGTSLE